MSGDTVTSESALQFTNDNKFCYAFSPAFDATTAQVTMLEFNTNSEYINAQFNYTGYMGPDGTTASAGLRGICSIYYNDIRVYQIMTDNDSGNMIVPYSATLIIPPFTKVTVKSVSTSATVDYVAQVAINGKVGMAQRVGNLDE
jgi:hypothetical protein